MADKFVGLVALLLGLMFLAASTGSLTAFDTLNSFARMRSLYGRIFVRILYLVLALLLLAVSAALFLNWRVF